MFSILGIGLGTMAIHLHRKVPAIGADYRPGDAIEGRVSYALSKPTSARRAIVGLRAKHRVLTRGRAQGGGVAVGHSRSTVYDQRHELRGEGIFSSGEHEFRIVVPRDAFVSEPAQRRSEIDDLARVAGFILGVGRFPLEWEVYAEIDIPFSVNLKRAVAIGLRGE